MKMKFKVGCQLTYDISAKSTFIFNISVVNNNFQQVQEENLKIEPALNCEEYVAPLLKNRYFRLTAPAGILKVFYNATVALSLIEDDPNKIPEIVFDDLPFNVLKYLYPSRYCQSDKLMNLAYSEFGNLLPDYSRVTAICNWIYDNVNYLSGSTDSQTSAYETATQRAGVCRDFAHLGIAFCRALNIPARFVSAYAYNLQPPDFHACFEAYLGNRWYLFDPTRLVPRKGLIRIGTGRDAADVSFATILGSISLQEMKISVNCLGDEPPEATLGGISTIQ